MMRQSTILATLLLLLAAVMAFLTMRLSPVARLVPAYVVVPTLALLSLALVNEIRQTNRAAARPRDTGEHRVLLWTLLLPGLCVLVGLVPAVLLFTFSYVCSRSRLSHWRSAVISVSTAAAVYGMSSIAVGRRAFEGWIWTVLGTAP